MGNKVKKVIFWIVILFLCFIACYPVWFLITGSLMGQSQLQQVLGPALENGDGYVSFPILPLYPTLRHYVGILLDSPEFFSMFWNSVKIAGGILLGQVIVSVPAAWGFARFSFPGKRVLFLLYIVLMMMPFQVTMLSNYLVMDGLGLLDTLWSIILPGIFSTFPVFLIYRFFTGIPEALMESARLDGAGEWQIFFRLGLPLGSAGIISAMVLGFLEYWNLIEQPLAFLKDKSNWPLSLYLPEISLSQAGSAFVASVLAMIPALFIFIVGRDYLERGIVAAAVKE
ncbi:MAG: carbohydrate ABC transporter permease [Lachnospiraceae bacterium]|nr:carbohydrate ABC transporter permease [Lachnospiraceae bacterium]